MSDALRIEKEEQGAGGRYVARIDGRDGEAELIFTRRGARLISADHTEAPVSLRGTGAAQALVERMVADARASGFRIAPVCPFVLAWSKKHPEWSDVFAAPT
ncbi:hypothetical protein DFR50_14223 [Roseiarcus fermentans]|uniref:N-acetyltransferase domain-containing protein n=1 Tax=Roseiarcus fermentans TaxID=1473586 RepID=A0A366EP76_9HYPH|nr:GNAT family N-acetyltransferase [Roseiarcus fermentans]RBP03776.1 hypothetical protein DFR50_14223 [Roseiarcus fermentans]